MEKVNYLPERSRKGRLLLVLVVGVVGQTRRDIIDVWSRIILEIVDRVDPAARSFLDRASRFVILLRAFLVAQAPRWRRRTKVRAAIASARSGWSSRTAWGETTATAGAGPEASRPWWTRRAILAGACFADGERPALEWLRVELTDDFFGFRAIGKLDECKSAWTTGLAVDRHSDVGRLCDGCEVRPEIGLTRTVGEVPDEQTDCQGLLVKSPLL